MGLQATGAGYDVIGVAAVAITKMEPCVILSSDIGIRANWTEWQDRIWSCIGVHFSQSLDEMPSHGKSENMKKSALTG
jgi:hypothetical protein